MIARSLILDRLLIWGSYGIAGFLFFRNWSYTRTALLEVGPDASLLATLINIIEAMFITAIVTIHYADNDWEDRIRAVPVFVSSFSATPKNIIKTSIFGLIGLILAAFVYSVYAIDINSTALARGADFGNNGLFGWIKALIDGETLAVGTVMAFVLGPELICFIAPFIQRAMQKREIKLAAEKDALTTQNKQLRMGRQLRDQQIGLEFQQQMKALKDRYSDQPQQQQTQGKGFRNRRNIVDK